MLASLVCQDPTGRCPDGATGMINQWREHAIRDRFRQAQRLAQMPSPAWRLNDLATTAHRSLTDVRQANIVLQEAGRAMRLPEGTYRALGTALDLVRNQDSHAA